jgi:chemotaxis protein CheC
MSGRYIDHRFEIDMNVKNDRYAFQMDAMSELGNIAAAHAATALSKLLGENILIDVPESNLYRVEDLPNTFRDIAEKVAVVQIDIVKEERGLILFVFPYKDALQLTNMFLKRDKEENTKLNDDGRSAICEIGNICACAYLNAISKFLDITLIPSPPGLAVDMPEAILQFPASIIGERSNFAIVIETKLTQNKKTFPGLILFIIDSDSQEVILDKIKLKTSLKA